MTVILRDYFDMGEDRVFEKVAKIESLNLENKIGIKHAICYCGVWAYDFTVVHENDFSTMEVRF